MSIALQADSSLPQGYILIDGIAAATIVQDGTIVAPMLSATRIRATETIVAPSLSATSIRATSVTFPDNSTIDTISNNINFKNRIINGGMRIDQRNNGNSFSAAAATLTYGVDRFYLFQTGAGVTGQRVASGVNGFPSAIRVTGATGNTYSEVSQRIESSNVVDLVGQSVTVSFIAAHSAGGTLSVSLVNPNSTDNYAASTIIATQTQVLSNTMTRYALTFSSLPVGVANGLLLVLGLAGGLGAGATFTLTGVQLERGSTATAFDYRPFGIELQLCQRYYQQNGIATLAAARTSTAIEFPVQYLVQMRALAAVTQGGVFSIYDAFGSVFSQSSASVTGAVTGSTCPTGQVLALNNFSGLTQGRTYWISNASFPAASLNFSAEL